MRKDSGRVASQEALMLWELARDHRDSCTPVLEHLIGCGVVVRETLGPYRRSQADISRTRQRLQIPGGDSRMEENTTAGVGPPLDLRLHRPVPEEHQHPVLDK